MLAALELFSCAEVVFLAAMTCMLHVLGSCNVSVLIARRDGLNGYDAWRAISRSSNHWNAIFKRYPIVSSEVLATP